ncbi:hypothetical protein MAM1_0172d07210 [Mucor ambiguus]|uniref:Uncharacterized protein n=1 Tax=Mucor ambiguus TaxID=91626 RepID=A0A0C9MZK6_9FUNG|nr:hypothetical protein MAM1_0172d07210 [Mucor ambiguus]
MLSFATQASVDNNAIQYFTSYIPDTDKILGSQHAALCALFTLDDLSDAATRAPHQSSPGIDSLPYAIIQVLFSHAATAAVAIRVFSDALLEGALPSSWQENCLVLLPKKGDLALLLNWRPFSLITLLLSLLAITFSFEPHSFLLSQPTNQGCKSLPLHSTNSFSSSSPLGAVK